MRTMSDHGAALIAAKGAQGMVAVAGMPSRFAG
jgi:hypothetical protein